MNMFINKKKVISGIRLREDRAQALKDKSFELSMIQKEIVKETDIINFLIDSCLEHVEIDDLGMRIKEMEEE